MLPKPLPINLGVPTKNHGKRKNLKEKNENAKL